MRRPRKSFRIETYSLIVKGKVNVTVIPTECKKYLLGSNLLGELKREEAG